MMIKCQALTRNSRMPLRVNASSQFVARFPFISVTQHSILCRNTTTHISFKALNMSAAVSPFPQAGLDQHDGLDDLFADMIGNDTNNHNGQYSSRDVNDQHDNNIDEEIQVKKKRKPVAKLDEARCVEDGA